jgi:hypothetical protein
MKRHTVQWEYVYSEFGDSISVSGRSERARAQNEYSQVTSTPSAIQRRAVGHCGRCKPALRPVSTSIPRTLRSHALGVELCEAHEHPCRRRVAEDALGVSFGGSRLLHAPHTWTASANVRRVHMKRARTCAARTWDARECSRTAGTTSRRAHRTTTRARAHAARRPARHGACTRPLARHKRTTTRQ